MTDDNKSLSEDKAAQAYDTFTDDYHLQFRDWQTALEREGLVLRHWFKDRDIATILDASCGPGTQSIALAQLGYRVLASDPSAMMIARAKENADKFNVSNRISFLQAGFLDIARMTETEGGLDAILTRGDAFPHLITDEAISITLKGFYRLLRSGGTVLIGMRDFEPYIKDRPRFMPGRVHDAENHEGKQTISFDVWDWNDGPPLTVTIKKFFVSGEGEEYTTRCYPLKFRALTAEEVQVALLEAGFENIEIIHDRQELVMIATKPK